MSAHELRVQVDEVGIHLQRGTETERRFPWGSGHWTIDLRDTRVPPPPAGPISGLPFRHATGRPRVTELTAAVRDEDRALLGLPPDPAGDPILLTNPAVPGGLSLHFGPLHVHGAALTDAQGRTLVLEAVRRGFEVRRSTGFAVQRDGGSAWCLVTEITTVRAETTPEVVP
ncbi:MAG TPA: hypothetical protein VMH90_06445 [Thermoplasmata archaeon]|nr:hypothetical protein [Thermoplasmata archaeon]